MFMPILKCRQKTYSNQGRRKVWKSGGVVVMGGDNVPTLVEIGGIDLPKTGGGGG